MLQALRTNIFIYLSQNVVLALLTFLEIVLFLSFGSFGSALSAPTEDIAPSCATVSPAFGLVITLILGWHHLSNRLESILLKPSRFLWLMALSVISCLATLGALSLLHAKKQAYFSLAVGILFTCTHLTDVILYYALISPPVVSLCHSGVSVLLAYTLHHRLGRVAKVKLFWPITTFGLLVPGFSKTLFVCLDMIMTTSGPRMGGDRAHLSLVLPLHKAVSRWGHSDGVDVDIWPSFGHTFTKLHFHFFPAVFALLWTIIALYQPNAMNLPTPFPKALIADSFDDGGVVDGEANPWHGLRSKADLDVGYLITCLRLFCLVCALPLVSHFAVSFTSYTDDHPMREALLSRQSDQAEYCSPRHGRFLRLLPDSEADLFTSLLVVCVTGSLIGIYYASASVSNLSPRLGVGEGERTMYLNDVASLILC
ncbi:unnamed protein product [Schistocephalus solidus]|uniref:Cytochrom_C_asm domain-containing protein n=1 Tax=Schistocephalus solidus TaxID=70667 RepID=A0A183T758_SCHSO|nr:unnamed protein product [Schistocephalus solidus]